MNAYSPGVTVVIPSIPTRGGMLARAVQSVARQSSPAAAISVAIDSNHDGAWATRNRAAQTVGTEWTAFLDDDDEFAPNHLRHLLDLAAEHDAQITWAWFEVVGGGDPFPHYRGRQYDPANPHIVPITYLCRTELLHQAMEQMGGFQPEGEGGGGVWDLQDMPLLNHMIALGARTYASDHSSWFWHHHGYGQPGQPGNTSGMPHRW